ncbi:MAG: Zn-dependent exopeptidase M28 [Ruminococcaceae bacterium]|nr:Zn-dependent exopeptidase M28 [Oscillospiraceae bacterium]
MKAKDSVKNYDSKIREYTNYSYRQSKNACKNYGTRPAGGENEKELQKHLVKELESCATTVKTEEFSFAKTSSLSENLFTLVFVALAVLLALLDCFGILGNSSLPATGVAVLVLLGYANIFTGFTSKLLAKKLTAENIYAVREADKEAKKRLILLANSDSAERRKFNTTPFAIISAVGFVVILVAVFLNASLDLFSKYAALKYASLALIVFVPVAAVPLFADKNEYSDGASKNLSGSFASIAVLKYLKDNNIEMPSAEICILITSAHEADCAGAKAFIKAHAEEFSDIPTICVGIDSIAFDEKGLSVIKGKNNEKSIAFLTEGAEDASVEISDCPLQGKYLPDAVAFANAGIDCCTITSLAENYEKEPDTHEDMKVKTIESALKTVVSGLFIYEENEN